MFGEAWPEFPSGDFEQLRQPIDFLGINYYTRGLTQTRSDERHRARHARPQPARDVHRDGWEVFPQGLTDILLWVHGALRQDRRSTSPRTAPRSTIRRSRDERPHRRSAARRLPAQAPATPCSTPSTEAPTSAATSSGRSSTTSSGPSATRSASASSTSTTGRSSARPKRARGSTRT